MRRAVGDAPETISTFGGKTNIADAERRNERRFGIAGIPLCLGRRDQTARDNGSEHSQ